MNIPWIELLYFVDFMMRSLVFIISFKGHLGNISHNPRGTPTTLVVALQTQDTHSSFPHLKKNLIERTAIKGLDGGILLQPDLSPHDISNISNDSNN